ncbi:type III secretion system chaperone [Motilimonas pumila]|uniref:Type III secretion system chaperone n=1 Tax=Motilimonas pumila TaxID=2303987 RepID=A0A418YFV3_9GAMM|nr:type III secretion system chaperone [Motilimonas pumila]RJG48428.1 hypothetical protein D1Z90_08005 [Motilimonas pumila]
MADLSRATALLQQLGPVMEPDAIRLHGEDLWEVETSALTIFLQYVEAEDRFTLYAELTIPASSDRTAVLELLLANNSQFMATGGVRMALSEPQGDAIMMVDLALEKLDVQQLQAVLQNFIEKHAYWKLAIGSVQQEAEETITSNEHIAAEMFRV